MVMQLSDIRLDPVDSILTINLSCWEDFETAIKDSFSLGNHPAPTSIGHFSPLLFRGQRNAEWGLRTTIERKHKLNATFKDYFKIIAPTLSIVESYTDKRFELPDFDTYITKLKETHSPFHVSKIPGYEFMVYLRHFGFPSPLLDWTESPYIAAYFAFADASDEPDSRAAIYTYREYAGYGKVVASTDAHIYQQDQNTRKHKRHFLQQCSYTVCIRNDKGEWTYTPYDNATKIHHSNQDLIHKYTIPTGERSKVLQTLNRYNINDFSLFESEESLMKTMAMRTFDFSST